MPPARHLSAKVDLHRFASWPAKQDKRQKRRISVCSKFVFFTSRTDTNDIIIHRHQRLLSSRLSYYRHRSHRQSGADTCRSHSLATNQARHLCNRCPDSATSYRVLAPSPRKRPSSPPRRPLFHHGRTLDASRHHSCCLLETKAPHAFAKRSNPRLVSLAVQPPHFPFNTAKI